MMFALAGFFSQLSLSPAHMPLWQQSGNNNVLLGIVLIIIAFIILIVFWRWWQHVEGEATSADSRLNNELPVASSPVEADEGPALTTAHFASQIVPSAERAVMPDTMPEAVDSAGETAAAEPEEAVAEVVEEAVEPAPDPVVAEAAPVTPDKLTKIEGIGPKISQLLQDDGILTFAQLAAADLARLERILTDAGPRYQLANPVTWSQQAALAAADKWDELQVLQDQLKGGRVDEMK